MKRDEQKQGSKERREHESATGGHADGGDYEYRRGGGDARDTSLGMENGTCAMKPMPGMICAAMWV